MYVTKVSIDDWEGNINTETVIPDISLESIESTIGYLDGSKHTLVTIENEDVGSSMNIGGGENNCYIVVITFNNEQFFTLSTDADDSLCIEMNVGGQYGDYPKSMCIQKDVMLKAARAFSLSGEVEESLIWEQS